jgi:DNA replication protein DnaC
VRDEAARRDATGIERRLKAARFEQTTTIEDYDFSFNPKIPAAQIRDWPRCGSSRPASRSSCTGPSAWGSP